MKKKLIPKHMKPRLKSLAKPSGFDGPEAFAEHLVVRGLAAHDGVDASAPLDAQLEELCDVMGYSSVGEAVEHLLERGLSAYANEDGLDREAFEARLRGLGYID